MATIKTSAVKEYNTAVVKQSGRVGTVRYYNRNGLTYVSAASNSVVTNNRTNAQMTQRLMFSSLAALYSTLGTGAALTQILGFTSRPVPATPC